jgi:hypothetical protein
MTKLYWFVKVTWKEGNADVWMGGEFPRYSNETKEQFLQSFLSQHDLKSKNTYVTIFPFEE